MSKSSLIRLSTAVRLGVAAVSCALIAGCGAYYASSMKGPLKRLQRGDYAGALDKLEKPLGDTNKLLYRLERGLIYHYQGEWEASNRQFEKAERLIDKLYTRSISRELAAFITNDAIRPYTGEEFERVLIQYYRALNYRYLGDPQASLVECRKANLRLADFAQDAKYELSYKNDAFIQYLTGVLYEIEGEWNDAYISYRDAEKGYEVYGAAFGMRAPDQLGVDLYRVASRLGYDDVTERLSERYGLETVERPSPGSAEAIVFVETGQIARKRQNEINIPIRDSDDTKRVWVTSERAVRRYRHPVAHTYKVKYWLKVALPYYESHSTRVYGARVSAAGRTARAELVEDLDAIAIKTLTEKEDTILMRTVARAIAKYTATKAAEEKSSIFGYLVNILGASTEAADTRSWLALPSRVHMARLSLPPGTVDLLVELIDNRGETVEEHLFPAVTLEAGRPVVLSHRSFR